MSYLPRFETFTTDIAPALVPALGSPASWSGVGRACVFDLEGNGLLRANAKAQKVTKLHCAVSIDTATGEIFQWRPWELEEAARFLSECHALIGHNILDYDLRALELLYPGWVRPAQVYDTLVMVRVIWPADTLWGTDLDLAGRGKMPPQFVKAHSLAAWGFRLGNYKGDYHGPWDVWSEEMQVYMVQDAVVNLDLWRRITSKIGWTVGGQGAYVWPALAFEIEHECARIILEQEETGFAFDREAAIALSAQLQNLKVSLEDGLVDHFGSWWQVVEEKTQAKTVNRKRPEFPDVTIPRFGAKGQPLKPYVGPPIETTFEGSTFTRIDRITFQPSSRDHLGQRLKVQYGWKPSKFGANGKPTVDETTLKEIPEKNLPPALRKTLLDYFVVVKTLGQLSVGRKSWLTFCSDDGRIHGRMNTAGAITGRGIHMDPNLGQVPGVEVRKEDHSLVLGIEGGFGAECRSLFMASTAIMSPNGEDWELTGIDASSLELICLGQYLQPLDGGAFLARVCDPNRDPHSEHAELTGLGRYDTKTVTYAYVYGASAGRVGEELIISEEEIVPLLNYKGLPQLLTSLRRRLGDDYVEPDDMGKARLAKGRIVILKFEKGIPGIKDLKDNVTATAEQRKWLKGLDGRKLYVRKAHAALNTLLQGAGAIICKLWMVLVHRRLKAAGLLHGIDYRQVAWVHDELQIEHRPGLGAVIGEIAKDAIREAGEILQMHGPLRGEAKTGRNWKETH